MGMGFQINDGAGGLVLSDTNFTGFIVSINSMSTASGSRVHGGLSNITGIVPVIYQSGVSRAYGGASDAAISYNAATQRVTWSGVQTVGFYALVGFGDTAPSYGIDIGSTAGKTTISHNFDQMVFIGKATLIANSGTYPTKGRFRLIAPAGVTEVIPFVYSTTGCMVWGGSRAGSTFYFDTAWESDNSAQIYCFAKHSQLSGPMSHGIQVRNAANLLVFDSSHGRNILRNIDTFTYNMPAISIYGQGTTPFTVYSAHPAKAKPAYAITLDGSCFDFGDVMNNGPSNTTSILLKASGTSNAAFVSSPGTWASPYTYIRSPATLPGLVIDGADYD